MRMKQLLEIQKDEGMKRIDLAQNVAQWWLNNN
jgi:hypothetical protein